MNKTRTFFIVDEFASLRRFDKFLEAMGRMRGYGVVFWVFLQALSQARHTYGDSWEVITGLAGVIQYFGGTADKLTAEKISEYAGKKTIPVPGITVQFGEKQGGSNNSNLTGRDVYMPDEVMRLPMPKQIVNFVGRGVAEAYLAHPSLVDFPAYLMFQQVIEEGYRPEQAVEAAQSVIARQASFVRQQPVPAPTSKPRRKPLDLNPLRWADKAIAKLLGHEDK